MRFSIAIVLAFSLFAFCLPDELLSEGKKTQETRAAADQTEKPARKMQAPAKAVVRDVVYGLEEDGRRLFLTTQPLDGADRELKRVELKFEIPKDGRVEELALAKLDGKNLMAVVKVHVGETYEFHCLTFIGPWGGGHVREKFAYYEAKFHSTRDELEILATDGKRGAVFIVLGTRIWEGAEDVGSVTEGVFYFTGCPWPPSDGEVSRFRAVSPPPK